MKETKTSYLLSETPVIPVEDLVINSVYFTLKNELVQVKRIDFDKKEIHLYNIGEQYHSYLPFDRHRIVRKVRN